MWHWERCIGCSSWISKFVPNFLSTLKPLKTHKLKMFLKKSTFPKSEVFEPWFEGVTTLVLKAFLILFLLVFHYFSSRIMNYSLLMHYMPHTKTTVRHSAALLQCNNAKDTIFTNIPQGSAATDVKILWDRQWSLYAIKILVNIRVLWYKSCQWLTFLKHCVFHNVFASLLSYSDVVLWCLQHKIWQWKQLQLGKISEL